MMSYFYRLFGGDGKQKQMDAPPPPSKSEAEKIADKKIKMEAALNELDVKIKSFEETEKKFDDWLDDLRSKAKELIEIGKEADAKKLSDEAKEVYKQAQAFTERKKHLVNYKFQLGQEILDMEALGVLNPYDRYFQIVKQCFTLKGSAPDESDEIFKELQSEIRKIEAEKIANVVIGPSRISKDVSEQQKVEDGEDKPANS